MRKIDADALIERVRIALCKDCKKWIDNGCNGCLVDNLVFEIIRTPTVEPEGEPDVLKIKAPCKVGDRVYTLSPTFGIREARVETYIIEMLAAMNAIGVRVENLWGRSVSYRLSDFGTMIFIDKEEAEAAQARMKGGVENG